MIIFYRFFSILVLPFLFIFTLIRILKKKENSRSFQEKLLVNGSTNNDYPIWFHGASIGEVKSIFPLVRQILKKKRNIYILISSTTLTSAQVVENEFKNEKRVNHVFLPYDIYFLVDIFIKKYKPKVSIFIDSEIWPNFILSLKEKSIPILLFNARISQRSFQRWNKINRTANKIFSYFSLIISSNQNTLENLNKLSIKNIEYFGNLKLLDLNSNSEFNETQKINFKNKKVWLAASTHPNEEEFIINAHHEISKKFSNLLTIIVPRHISRVNAITKMLKKKEIRYQIISDIENFETNSEIILVNAVGKLNEFYNSCKTVFIGKSLEKKISANSGQNPIEPLKFGCDIIHGPYVKNFEEIYSLLNKRNLAKKVTSIDEFVNAVILSLNKDNLNNESKLKTLKEDARNIENKVMTLFEKYLNDV